MTRLHNLLRDKMMRDDRGRAGSRATWLAVLLLLHGLALLAACSDDPPEKKKDASAVTDVADTAGTVDGDEGETLGDGGADASCSTPGCACEADADCTAGPCLDLGAGKRCWDAATLFCAPCLTDAECQVFAAGAACVDRGASGSFCGLKCAADADCGDGYSCVDGVNREGAAVKQCVPKDDALCTCSDFATEHAVVTLCQEGKCPGERACLPAGHPDAPSGGGMSACRPLKQPEKCDGLDNDCNGQVDDGQSCDDGNPCTNDTCVGSTCAHTPAAGACEDGDACTEQDQCKGGACDGGSKKVCVDGVACTTDSCDPATGCSFLPENSACDDGKPCTTDTCAGLGGAAKAGCTFTALQGCDPAFIVPHKEAFSCDSKTAAKWQLTGVVGGPRWALDKTPDPPGFHSAPCSLNFNDGKDYQCPKGLKIDEVGGTATSPWFFDVGHKPGHGLELRAKVSGDWEKSGFDDLDVLISGDGKTWQKLGNLDWEDPKKWYDLKVPLHGWAGKKFRLRFHFYTLDCINNETQGPFIDDLEVVAVPCAQPEQCNDGDPCTTDTCDAAKGCQYKEAAICESAKEVPYATDFACGGPSAKQWYLNNEQSSPGWAIDGTPGSPGFLSPPCALNFNDGKDFQCQSGQQSVGGDAVTPRLSALKLAPGSHLFARFSFSGTWEANEYDNLMFWGSTNGVDWQQLANFDPPKSGWQKVSIDVSQYAGKKFWLSFTFTTEDCESNGGTGPFIDDFFVSPTACLTDEQCGDGNPCTVDTCKVGFGCQHAKQTAGPCDDDDACTEGGQCDASGQCVGKAVTCDDDNKCTTDVCDPKVGCKTKPIDGCGPAHKPPLGDDFSCGGHGALTWTLSAATEGPAWAIDGTPSPPGFTSPLCSLNFNDGKSFSCAPGQESVQGTATSHWIDLTSQDPGAKTLLRFKLAGAWEKGHWDRLRLLATTDGKAWTDVVELEHAAPLTWTSHAVNIAALSGQKFRLRFAFETTDCFDNNMPGPFIDDLSIQEPPCAGNADCDDNNPCTDDSCGKNGKCDRLKKAAGSSCADGQKCLKQPTCDALGQCVGPPIDCNDSNPCTIDSCAPSVGCLHKPIQGCGGPIAIPHNEPFHCTSPSAGAWTLELADAVTPVGAPSWGIDATPAIPGSHSPLCSLNFNNGSSYECGPGQAKIIGTATSLWFAGDKLPLGADLRVRFELSGAWEKADFDKLLLLATVDQKSWTTVASLNHPDPKAWKPEEHKLGAFAGSKFKFAFYFETSDCVANSEAGPFIDDLQVFVAGCKDDLGCDDGDVCTDDTCGSDQTCSHQPAAAACSDNNACTEDDKCAPGGCVGKPVSCEDDGNPCTAVSCDSKLGCVLDHLKAACSDGDPCTSGDTCKAGKCTAAPTDCDDSNPCTVDTCNATAGGCQHAALPGPCDDGNPCTTGGVCKDGGCKSGKTCDDGNSCTVDTCKKAGNAASCSYKTWNDGTFCDDGDTCSGGDTCKSGACVGGASTCACSKAGDCKDDGNPCTTAACTAGKCTKVLKANGAACDDGDACTTTTKCKSGLCAGAAKSCDDGNACTADTCDAKTGTCSSAPLAAACDDNDKCTAKDRCEAGKCVGSAVSCNDGDRCTNDSCDASKGCEHSAVADGGKCNDNDACTGPDTCKAGKCDPPKLSCDDNNPCTANNCHVLSGCAFADLAGKCDDGDPCTGADACAAGQCVGKVKTCDDRNSCTVDSCDTQAKPGAECVHKVVASGGCDDGDACTQKDVCKAGKCVGVVTKCDDGSDCTIDSCDKTSGLCVTTPAPAGGPCDDGNPCTIVDTCSKGGCVGQAKPCDDNLPCTQDGCSDKGECTHKALADGVPCSDGDPCTLGDACKNGSCSGGAKQCTDADPCSNDSCDGATGDCKFTPVPGNPACDDGNACTSNDACAAGKCTGKAVDCSDNKPCTADTCDPAGGACSHAAIPDGGGCDDGDPCSVDDLCQKGACAGGKNSCDDGNACTIDSCAAGKGCQHKAAADGKACDDGDLCTSADACSKGACAGKAKTCDDGTPCTTDSCDGDTGQCVHVAAPGACDDGNACTAADKCVGGACAGNLKSCGDGDACASKGCDPKTGKCLSGAQVEGGPCDDGAPCTADDRCKGGKCVGAPKSCDDANPCTANQCNAKTGQCAHPALQAGAKCDDGNLCTVDDRCTNGGCAGTAKDCSDGKDCTADACAKTGTCQHVPIADGDGCDDGNACTVQDACSGGTCSGVAKSCDPLGPCLDHVCGVDGGCKVSAKADGGGCDDGLSCTGGDTCKGGECVGKDKACDDTNPCTNDYCAEPDGSCKANPVSDGGACDDGKPCTVGDICTKGSCAGVANPCEDGNPCTKGSCAAKDGKAVCNQAPDNDGAKCDDGSKCTLTDACASGTCTGKAVGCQGEACQVGSCDPGSGSCSFTAAADNTACSDDNACTTGDLCSNGTCAGSPDGKCTNGGNTCVLAQCDPKSGACKLTNAADATLCNDDNACTESDACAAGKCAGKGKSCDDGNSCTVDACQASGTCTNTPAKDGSGCSDGNACTVNDACASGGCEGAPKDCSGTASCTTYSCDPAAGRKSAEVTACKSALKLPYNAPFDCGGAASKAWSVKASSAGQPAWSVDGTPANPGFSSKSCALNFNDGKSYACPAGFGLVDATVTSPWLDATAIAPPAKLALRMKVGGSWEGAPHDVLKVLADVEGQADPVTLGAIAPPTSLAFGADPVLLDISVLAGKRFALRLSFATDDCSNNDGTGPFIDDLFVGKVQCLADTDCTAGHSCAAGTCQPPPKAAPDLQVTKITIDAAAPPATKINFVAHIKNGGSADLTDAFDLGFVVNSKADGSGAVAHSWKWSITGGLSKGQTRTVGGWFKLSASHPPGTWHLVGTVDPQSKLEDANPANNRSSAPFTLQPPPKPDLTVTKLTAPQTVQAGKELALDWEVTNAGKGSASASSLGLFISPNASFFSYVLLGSAPVSSMGNGQSRGGTVKLLIPPTTAPGKYAISARADTGQAIAEAKENNNHKEVFFNVTAAPASINLRPTLLQPEKLEAVAGQSLKVKVAWTNDGNTASGPFTAALHLAAGSKVALTDTKLDQKTHTAILPGHTKTFEHTITVPANATTGSWALGFFLDTEGKVNESDETDNSLVAALQLFSKDGGPDLISTATSVVPVDGGAGTLQPGDSFRFLPGMGCKNVGDKAAAPFSLKVFISKNPLLSGGDLSPHTGHYQVKASLGAGETFGPYANKFTLPASVGPGKWHIGVLCDHQGAIAETDETNNGASFAIEVAGRPDLQASKVQLSATAIEAGGKLQATVALANIGTAAAGARTDTLYLSNDATIDSKDVKLADFSAVSLQPGAIGKASTATITIPQGTGVGSYFVGLRADSGAKIDEIDEGNNTVVAKLEVVAAKPVTIAGTITYDRVPALDKSEGGPRLGLDKIKAVAARRVKVQAIDAGDGATVLATVTTNDAGSYVLSVPAGKKVKVRALAWLQEAHAIPDQIGRDACKGAAWDARVVDNTNNDSQWAIESPEVQGPKTGWNLHAATTHNGSSYTSRSGAPFALADDLLSVFELLCEGQADAQLPRLYMNWSPNNVREQGDKSKGQIGIPHYSSCGVKIGGACFSAIFMAGAEDFDSDEYDDHITGHEAGHFVERQFFRSDSMGGSHGVGNVVDMALSWGEGYGTVYGALALGDPVLVDTSGTNGQKGWQIDLGAARPAEDRGVYSEVATARLIYRLWDLRDGKEGDGKGSFDRAFTVMRDWMAPGPAYSSPLAFGAYYNALFGDEAESFKQVWSQDFNTPYDALCPGSCSGNSDKADVFDSDNDIGKYLAAFKTYPESSRAGAKQEAAAFWQAYRELSPGVNLATGHEQLLTRYANPKLDHNKVGANRHYVLTGSGKLTTVKLENFAGKGCGGTLQVQLWAFTMIAPRERRQLAHKLGNCPAVTFETEAGKAYIVKVQGGYDIKTGWTFQGGPDAGLASWDVVVTEQ